MKNYGTIDYEDYEPSPLLPNSSSELIIARPTWNLVNQIIVIEVRNIFLFLYLESKIRE